MVATLNMAIPQQQEITITTPRPAKLFHWGHLKIRRNLRFPHRRRLLCRLVQLRHDLRSQQNKVESYSSKPHEVAMRVVRLAAYISIAFGWLACTAGAQELDERTQLLNELMQFSSQYQSNRYNKILGAYSKLRGGGLCINRDLQRPAAACIDLVIIKHAAISSPPKGAFSNVFAHLNHNATAFEPSLIMIDEQWLDLILVSIVNQYTYATRIEVNSLETAFAQARYQLFTNMRRSFVGDSEYAKWLKPLDQLADDRIAALTANPPPKEYDAAEQNLLIATLSVLFEHEIAHLDTSSPFFQERRSLEETRSSGSLSLDSYREQRRAIQLKEEERADKIALDKAEKLIAAQLPADLKARPDVLQLYMRVPLLGMSSLFETAFSFMAWTPSGDFAQKT
jgi:hypothetical protein